MARARCLYCGAVLGRDLVEAAAAAAEALASENLPPPPPERHLVVLDLTDAPREVLASALRVSAFEADQRLRRGGYQLHRIAAPEAAREDVERLQAAGLRVRVVPEGEARAAASPDLALGAIWDGRALALRTVEGPREVRRGALLLMVRGPIARAREEPHRHFKRVRVAGPSEGHRIHLHLRTGPQPIELDPDNLEMGEAPAAGSVLAALLGWLREIAEGAAVDEGFRFVTPALDVAQPPLPSAAQALDHARARKGARPMLLDNVAQFRFYSGWRAAVERAARDI